MGAAHTGASLTFENVEELLHYDPQAGGFSWKTGKAARFGEYCREG